MKHIKLLFLFLLISITAMAQDGFLIIDGINESATQEKMILTKVKLDGAQSYVVKKKRDAISDLLQNAATAQSVFSEARLWERKKNGNRFVYVLTDVSISSYNTKGRFEEFTVHFSKSKMEI